MKKRLLWYVGDSGMCSLIRVRIPDQYISAYSDWEIREANTINQADTQWLIEADKKVAIFQRQYGRTVLAHLNTLKKYGVICGYESDDLVTSVQVSNPAWTSAYGKPELQKCIREFLSTANFLLVSTEGIKKEWKKYNDNVYVIENYINWKDLPIKEDEEFKIILTGSTSHIEDWANCISAVEQLPYNIYAMGFHECLATNRDTEALKQYKDRKYIYPDNVHIIPWMPYSNYIDELYKLSGINTLGLCFIDEIPFNSGKSNLKLLEYALTGSCILANRFGPYEQHPVFYAKNRTYEIKKAIEKFKNMRMEDKKKQVIGQKLHFSKWDIAKRYDERIDFLNKIVGYE